MERGFCNACQQDQTGDLRRQLRHLPPPTREEYVLSLAEKLDADMTQLLTHEPLRPAIADRRRHHRAGLSGRAEEKHQRRGQYARADQGLPGGRRASAKLTAGRGAPRGGAPAPRAGLHGRPEITLERRSLPCRHAGDPGPRRRPAELLRRRRARRRGRRVSGPQTTTMPAVRRAILTPPASHGAAAFCRARGVRMLPDAEHRPDAPGELAGAHARHVARPPMPPASTPSSCRTLRSAALARRYGARGGACTPPPR